MPSRLTRRHLIQAGGAVSLAALLPRAVFSQGAGARKAVVHADREIGVIRPEFLAAWKAEPALCGLITVSTLRDRDTIKPHPVVASGGSIRVDLPAMSSEAVAVEAV